LFQHRLNLAGIERALRDVQRAFPEINERLNAKRDPMSDRIVEHMLAGYAFVDRLLAQRIDVLKMGQLSNLLELNHLVLCGVDPEERRHVHRHMAETERHFYETENGGVRDLVEWLERHPERSPWRRAAGAYVRILSEPQLFIEGNHRAGALIMSYLLAQRGAPPFVLTAANAEAYFRPSTLIRVTRKDSFSALWKVPQLVKRFAAFLERECDPSLLIRAVDADRPASELVPAGRSA
jgi:hypothetical protein